MTTDEPTPLVSDPSFPDLVKINFQKGSFTSFLTLQKKVSEGEKIITLRDCILNQPKAYTTVQYSERQHLELNNEFVYMNHSCDPSIILDVSDPLALTIIATRTINQGGELTFDYCATEWDMNQPFTCTCQAQSCRGTVQGAKYLSAKQLAALVGVNPHILALTAAQ